MRKYGKKEDGTPVFENYRKERNGKAIHLHDSDEAYESYCEQHKQTVLDGILKSNHVKKLMNKFDISGYRVRKLIRVCQWLSLIAPENKAAMLSFSFRLPRISQRSKEPQDEKQLKAIHQDLIQEEFVSPDFPLENVLHYYDAPLLYKKMVNDGAIESTFPKSDFDAAFIGNHVPMFVMAGLVAEKGAADFSMWNCEPDSETSKRYRKASGKAEMREKGKKKGRSRGSKEQL